ncbi:MAG: hypothetical protein NT150_09755 [Bacteroidetes bacterium]|nr:hypothetical protein [Bacteroidota bacterium]
MKLFITLICCTCLLACADGTQGKYQQEQTFNFSQFPIGKLEVGPIKIGQKLHEVEKHFKGLQKENIDAWTFGFDGPSEKTAVLYSLHSQPLIAFIPYLETDSIIAIIVIHKNFKTKSGISPSMTVGAILKVLPNAKSHYNPMMDYEEIDDLGNLQSFIFTSNQEAIANYPEVDSKSTPTNLKPKIDWITVFKEDKGKSILSNDAKSIDNLKQNVQKQSDSVYDLIQKDKEALMHK